VFWFKLSGLCYILDSIAPWLKDNCCPKVVVF
jgi:hypothetical protein